MISTPDQLVQSYLQQGLDGLRADRTGIDDLFMDMDQASRDYIYTWLCQNTNIKVRLGWPPRDIVMPAINVMLGSETENVGMDVLGDHLEDHFYDATETGGLNEPVLQKEILGFGQDITLNVMIITRTEEGTPYLYQIVKRILFAAKMQLEKDGLINVKFSGGDFRFEEGYFPEFTWSRILNINGGTFFQMTGATEWVAKTITQTSLIVETSTGLAPGTKSDVLSSK